MRIISGEFRGKKLALPKDNNTRPLKDMVKESIFNLLDHSNKFQIKLENSCVLDLFSGSGSFGLECISRRSKIVYFFENYPKAIEVLKKNLLSLKDKKNYKIFNNDCIQFFNSKNKLDKRFDIIFLDPPYKENDLNKLIRTLINEKFLKENGILIIHRHKNHKDIFSKNIKIIEEKKYGISKIIFGIII